MIMSGNSNAPSSKNGPNQITWKSYAAYATVGTTLLLALFTYIRAESYRDALVDTELKHCKERIQDFDHLAHEIKTDIGILRQETDSIREVLERALLQGAFLKRGQNE